LRRARWSFVHWTMRRSSWDGILKAMEFERVKRTGIDCADGVEVYK
jgi:hypothetical protein